MKAIARVNICYHDIASRLSLCFDIDTMPPVGYRIGSFSAVSKVFEGRMMVIDGKVNQADLEMEPIIVYSKSEYERITKKFVDSGWSITNRDSKIGEIQLGFPKHNSVDKG